MSQHTAGPRQDGFRPHKNKTITIKPTKPKRWSHQDDLDAAIGKQIRLHISSGTNNVQVQGELVAADQFTIKVKRQVTESAYSLTVYNKSALTSFEVKS